MIKLHLGCGNKDFGNSWIHIDKADFSHIKYHDVKKLEFSDNSVDLIYSSHMLEYFDREEVKKILLEWYRVLKFDGVLKLAVPDFEAISNLYSNNSIPLSSFIGPLYGKMKVGDEYIYHKTAYDFNDLSAILLSVGFKNIKFWDWRDEIKNGFIDDCSRAHFPHNPECIKNENFEGHTLISLNIEANK